MILLFVGSTPIVREAIAEKIVSGNAQWRHLAIEELAESVGAEEGKDYDVEKLLAIVCHCAEVMRREGYHLILSLGEATELLPSIRKAMEGDCLSIHLGEPGDDIVDTFDHVINTANASINDIHEFLRPLIDSPPDA